MNEVRAQTSGMLSEIDDILTGVSGLSARIAFGNLFPIDEDDAAIGEKYVKDEYDPDTDRTGQDPFVLYCSAIPKSHSLDEEVEYCEVCLTKVKSDKPYREYVRNRLVERNPDGFYYYINNFKEREGLGFQPYLMDESLLSDFESDAYHSEEVLTLVEWLSVRRPSSADALEYSIDFFGGEEFVWFETEYGSEAETLEGI